MLRIYPHKFWATFYICIIAAVQQVVTGLCIDRSKIAWRLALNLQLITIFYSVIMENTNYIYSCENWKYTKKRKEIETGSNGNSSIILLGFVGSCRTWSNLYFHVQSTVNDFCGHLGSSFTGWRNYSRKVKINKFLLNKIVIKSL